MAEPVWEDTSPITSSQATPAPAGGLSENTGVPTWENTIDTHEKYGTTGQQVITGLEGFAKGIAGPLATGAEKMLGVPEEDIIGRAKENPTIHTLSEVGGFAAPAIASAGMSAAGRMGLAGVEALDAVNAAGKFTQAGVLGKIGQAAAEATGFESQAAKLATHIGVENALFQAGDEVSKEIQGNPNSIQTAAADVGLAAIIGAATGGVFGGVSDLWTSKVGQKAEKFLNDFQTKMKDNVYGPAPEMAAGFGRPIQDASHAITWETIPSTSIGAEINGASPAVRDAFHKEASSLVINPASGEDELAKILGLPQVKSSLGEGWYQGQGNPNVITTFEAVDPAKVDQYARVVQQVFKQDAVPYFAPKFSQAENPELSKGVLFSFSEPLSAENQKVFSDALGGALKENAGYTKLSPNEIAVINFKDEAGLPTLNENEFKKALETLGSEHGERLKINDAVEFRADAKYGPVHDWAKNPEGLHDQTGAEGSPDLQAWIRDRSDAYNELLKKWSGKKLQGEIGSIPAGAKAADFVYKHALKAASEGVSGTLGAIGGHATGIPGAEILGAYFGHHAIKPLTNTIIPALIKPILKSEVTAVGLKSAMDAIGAVVKGENLAAAVTKSIFSGESESLPNVSDKDIEKLDKRAQELEKNPEGLLGTAGAIGHYMPNHATALSATAANAVNYLNAQRPRPVILGPLDKQIEPTKMQQATYKRTLQIAQQPLVALERVKNGTIQSKDLHDLNAMYPQFYSSLRQKVYQELVNHVSKEGVINYDKRMGLSLFLGTPLDNTLSPESILSAQVTFVQNGMNEAAKAQQQAPKKSTASLSKASTLVGTPMQARVLDKQSP